jgi:hypothetical protein
MNASLLALAALASGCLAVRSAPAPPGAPGPEGQARIAIDRGEAYLVRALFDGAADESLTYRLEVVREGPAGRSQSAQGGAFESAPSRTDTLSMLRVSATSGDHFRARLVVSRGNDPVSESVVEETVE